MFQRGFCRLVISATPLKNPTRPLDGNRRSLQSSPGAFRRVGCEGPLSDRAIAIDLVRRGTARPGNLVAGDFADPDRGPGPDCDTTSLPTHSAGLRPHF